MEASIGFPWAVFTTGLILFLAGLIAAGITAWIIEELRTSDGSTYVARVMVTVFLVVSAIGFLAFLSSFWIGTLGYGWFA